MSLTHNGKLVCRVMQLPHSVDGLAQSENILYAGIVTAARLRSHQTDGRSQRQTTQYIVDRQSGGKCGAKCMFPGRGRRTVFRLGQISTLQSNVP